MGAWGNFSDLLVIAETRSSQIRVRSRGGRRRKKRRRGLASDYKN